MIHLQNQQIEFDLIAELIKRNDLFFRINDRVAKEDFTLDITQRIFEDISNRLLVGGTVTFSILGTYRAESEEAYLALNASISNASSLTPHALSYANEIRELSRKRALYQALNLGLHELKTKPLGNTVDELSKTIQEIYGATKGSSVKTGAVVIQGIIDEIQNKTPRAITSTGFARIDKTMNGGLEGGKVYVFGARPKCGKTMMLGTIANHLRKQSNKFLFIAAEMGSNSIMRRLMANEAQTWATGLKDTHAATLVAEVGKSSRMMMLDAPRISLQKLESFISMSVERYGIEGFVLDYMQLVSGKDGKTSSVEHLENVAQTVAELCKRFNIWCLTACQINKQEDGARGGDGILMAIDWFYQINKIEDVRQDIPKRVWLQHLATREGGELDIGSDNQPYMQMAKFGTHFMEIQ